MGLLDKVKNLLNIGGLKIEIVAPNAVNKEDGVIKGDIIMTSERDVFITDIEIKLVYEVTHGKGAEATSKTIFLGEKELLTGYKAPVDEQGKPIPTVHALESLTYDFELPFKMRATNDDSLKSIGGVMGGLGKLGQALNQESTKYYLQARVDMKGSLGETVTKDIIIN